jgi:acetyl-CoA synthetase
VLGVSPTLIRALKTAGDEHPARHDLSSLRVFGSTGEPWNPEPYRWLSEVVGGGRLPIINISGGTEVGACFITPYPVEPIKECSLGGASHGMDIDVFDADGKPVRGKVGELVCKQPWPGMTRGIWGDPDRYIDTYWSMYPDVWRHGDWALIDEEGDWYLLGRSDDTINVAGKRVGPAEIESALLESDDLLDAAAIAAPDPLKGVAVVCVCVAATGVTPDDAMAERLSDVVSERIGKPFRPREVLFVEQLPKTRNMKTMRRVVRSALLDQEPGDLSALVNPEAVDLIRRAARASA